MAVTLIKIPTGETSWLEGECGLAGYEGLLVAQQVNFDLTVDSAFSEEGRRTVHVPKVSPVQIERKVDLGTADLTKYALGARVSKYPWEIYFLRSLGGGSDGGALQVKFLTLKLHRALITSQSIAFEAQDMTESLEVSAAALEWVYTFYDSSNQPRGQVAYKFDVQKGWVS